MTTTTSSTRANDLDINYTVEGQGPPLLMLHGATSMGTHDWGAQRPLLRGDFTLYMPDARGHRRTIYDVRQGWSRDTLVDDALAFADALGLEQRHDSYQGAGAWRRLMEAIRDDTQWLTSLTPEELHRIRMPALLAYGDRDPWVPLEQAVRVRRQLPEARLLIVPE